MFNNYPTINYLHLSIKTINFVNSLKQFLFSIFDLQKKAEVLKVFLAFLLFLPIAQNNLFAQSCSSAENFISLYGYTTGVVDENEMINPGEALNELIFVPNATNFHAKFDKTSDFLVLDLECMIQAGIPIALYIDTDDYNAATLQVQGTLTVTAYKKDIL